MCGGGGGVLNKTAHSVMIMVAFQNQYFSLPGGQVSRIWTGRAFLQKLVFSPTNPF